MPPMRFCEPGGSVAVAIVGRVAGSLGSTSRMRICRFTLFLAVGVLTGCVPLPFPHTSERFPAMQGHVVDATTAQPIPSAIVAVHDHPNTTAKTDKTGAFRLSKCRNYHYGLMPGICATSWPEGSDWSWVLDVSHPAYDPCQIDAGKVIIPSHDDKPYRLRDIRLSPKAR